MTYALTALICALYFFGLYCYEWNRRKNYRRRLRLIERRNYERLTLRR